MRGRKIRNLACALALAGSGLFLSGCARSPQEKSAAYVAAGKKLMQANDPARAILQFRNAVQATPAEAEPYYQLSRAYFAAGDVKLSINSLRKALDVNPRHSASRLWMAQLQTMASDPTNVKQGRDALAEILKESPDNIEAIHSIGLADIKLGEPEDAMQHLTRALALVPGDLVAAVSIAQAKLQQNDTAGAETVLVKATQDLPKSSDAAVVLGEFYAGRAKWADADRELRRAVALNPKSGWALFHLAALVNGRGQKDEAERLFKQLSELDKSYKSIHASFLFQEGRKAEAVQELEKLSAADPEDRGLRTQLIVAYRTSDRMADAQKALDAALKRNPKDADALLQKAELLMADGKYLAAAPNVEQVLHLQPDWAEAQYVSAKLHQAQGETRIYREQLMKALELNPLMLRIRIEAAQAMVSAGDPAGAQNLLDAAADYQRKQLAVVVERNWIYWAENDMASMRKGIDAALASGGGFEALLQDGVWNLRTGKYTEARTSLEKALDVNPGDMRALRALSESYQVKKQDAAGIQEVKQYASRQPKSAPVQDFLGMMLAVQGDRAQARKAFEASKAADPKFVLADLSLVQLDVVDGKLDDAQQRLKSVLASNPGNATARFWSANVELMKGDKRAALEDLRQAVQSDPNNAAALNNYAYLLSENAEQTAEALKYAQRAKELAPNHTAYSDTLGWILYERGLYSMAVSELERASGGGGDALCNYHLAMAYAKLGNLDGGRKALQAGLKQNPNLTEAKTAREMLGMQP